METPLLLLTLNQPCPSMSKTTKYNKQTVNTVTSTLHDEVFFLLTVIALFQDFIRQFLLLLEGKEIKTSIKTRDLRDYCPYKSNGKSRNSLEFCANICMYVPICIFFTGKIVHYPLLATNKISSQKFSKDIKYLGNTINQ